MIALLFNLILVGVRHHVDHADGSQRQTRRACLTPLAVGGNADGPFP